MNAPPEPGSCPDILLVDDDPVSIAAISGVLSASGYSVASAPSGESALRAAPGMRPRLLILDVGMPGIDGYSVCRQLRAHPATAEVPILFLSGSASVDARLSGLHAGGIDFLAKPCDERELLARVGAHLRLAAARETLAAHNRTLATANHSLRSGLSAASRVQMAMLPHDAPVEEGLRFGWRCLPCEQLGGDMLNIFRIAPGRYAISILDASGHGVPAALLAVSSSHIISALFGRLLGPVARDSPTPAEVLDGLNNVLLARRPGGMFVTALVGIVDATAGSFTFASAGHPGPLLIRHDGVSEFIDEGGPPAGLSDQPFANHRLDVGRGDRFVLYSDGAYEQPDPEGERFGRERLRHHATRSRHEAPTEFVNSLIQRIDQWRGPRGLDDDLSIITCAQSTWRAQPR